MARLGAIAADVTARAVMRGVFAADDVGEHRCYRSVWGHRLKGR